MTGMGKDIRFYFNTVKAKKAKVDDDNDVIPESPDVQIKNKKKESRKKRVLSDSDDEIFTKKKKQDGPNKSTKNKSPVKPKLKEAKASDIFGKAPIKRSDPIVIKNKKKTETGIHSDEEFDKSLLELDDIEALATKSNHDKKDISKVDKLTDNDKTNTSTSTKSTHINKKGDSFTIKEELKVKQNSDIPNDDANKKNRNNLDIKKEKVDFSEFLSDDVISKSKKPDNEEPKLYKDKDMNEDAKNKNSKRNFNESNASFSEDHESKSKKRKLSLNDSVLTDEERYERRRHAAASYQKYLNRSGPKHLGTKEIPQGTPNCLSDCAVLITGVLDSFEREEVTEAITKYGGCVKGGISKKVTHVLAGEDAGEAKLAKARDLGIKIINEDEFIQMIIDKSQKQNNNRATESKSNDKGDESSNKQGHKTSARSKSDSHDKNKVKDKKTEIMETEDIKSKIKLENASVKSETRGKHKEDSPKIMDTEIKPKIKFDDRKSNNVVGKTDSKTNEESNSKMVKDENEMHENGLYKQNGCHIMWVDKYKPQNVKQIIGQHGDASNVKKLSNWLTKWYANRKAKIPKPSPWAKNDDGAYYKAALLSGPPGVGKTTTVSLVCKELGFDVVEFNASDTRNKTLIREQIGELLSTNSLSGFAKGDTGKQAVSKKHVLVMDEVDGMAGNEDRGGLQELISLIKSASVPIICMCNDRNSQKMRSFVNYCYDLRFSRPRVDQIKSAMMSVCFKEGIKIPADALTQLITSANQDVRQTLHLLSMWAADPSLTDAERLKRDAKGAKKDVKLGPWEAIRKVFSAEEHKGMTLNDRSDLFFYDYSLAPLFVQENYLQVAPHCPKHEVLERISKAADSISAGDLVDARIRRNQAWSLLPLQAMYSSVIPGHHMAGHVTGQIQFPGWLGKNSRASKMQRLCQEIHAHTRLSTSGSKSSIFLDYAAHLRDAITKPLIKDKSEGIERSLNILEAYHLLREDLDSLTELSLWPGQRNPTVLIDSKVKAAMTRTYNKSASALPYAPPSVKRGRPKDEDADDEIDDADVNEDSDPENDALIKKKKTKEVEKSNTSKEKQSSSKEKASSSKGKKKK